MTPTDSTTGVALTALFAMTAIQAIVTMASLTVSVLAPQLAGALDVRPEAIGVYASLTYIGAMFGSLIAGGFVLRYGAVRFSQVVMLICALGLLVCIGADAWWFLLSAIILGLGYGPTTPASSHLLALHTPERLRSLVFSVKQTGVPLGSALAGLLVPWLMVGRSWQDVTIIVALIVIVAAIALSPIRRTFDANRNFAQPLLRGNVVAPLRLIMRRRDLRLLALATFFFSSTQQSYIYFLVTHLEINAGWSTQQAGFALSIVGFSAVAGRIVWGAIADATRRTTLLLGILATGMALATASTALIDHATSSALILGTCAIFGVTGASWNGLYLAEISRRVDSADISRATGGALFVTFAGVVVTPPVFGLIAHLSGGFALGYFLLAAIIAVIAALFFGAARSG